MRLSTILLGGAAVLGLSSAAFAADLVIEEPAAAIVAPTYDWSGVYVGGHLGYAAGQIDLDVLGVGNAVDDSVEVDGWVGGVQLGYNWQFDRVVVGVQTDVSFTGIESEEAEGGVPDTIDWLGSTTARLGIALDNLLPYVKAGVAYAGGTGNQGDPPDNEAVEATFLGWTAGVGLEYAIADNISIFGEYGYYDLGTETLDFTASGTVDVDASPGLHVVKAGLNLSF